MRAIAAFAWFRNLICRRTALGSWDIPNWPALRALTKSSGGGVYTAMDPTQDRTYKFLDKFIAEMAKLFPDAYFHIGGDEVNGKPWDSNPKIQAFMHSHGMKNNQDLQAYFNNAGAKNCE